MTGRLRRFGPNLNWQLIVPVVSGAVLAAGLGMFACCVAALIAGQGDVLAFGAPAAVLVPLAGAGVLGARRLRSMPLRARDGFFAVTAAWLAAAVVGAAPFLLAGTFDRALDAFFESMSGFTTTGATLIDDLEAQPDAILLWRSVTEWLGGVGIVVLVVAIAPATGLATQRVFYAETSRFTDERLTPRIADTAKIIVSIYVGLTAVGLFAYPVAGMGAFDALNHSFTTISSGGFSTRNGSIGAFDSLAVDLVAIVFMMAAGINLAFYWRAIRGRDIRPQTAEVRAYLLLIAASIAIVAVSLALNDQEGGFFNNLRESAFSATAMMTGTGFVIGEFDGWNDFARGYLVLLTFIGGCAGSTTGGLKVVRVMLLGKIAGQEVGRQLSLKAVQVLRTRGRIFSEDIRRGVLGFFVIYLVVLLGSSMAMLASGLDLTSAFSTAAVTLNIVGTGIGSVGAFDNYGDVSEGGRVVLSLVMLAGRLEIFTVLVLLTPAFWRPNVA